MVHEGRFTHIRATHNGEHPDFLLALGVLSGDERRAINERFVAFVDRAYDAQIPVRATGEPLDRVFAPEMLTGGYRKKYLRATSRLLALSRQGGL